VGVGTCWPWETNCYYVAVCSAAQGASAPTGGERGRGIPWRPPAYGLLMIKKRKTSYIIASRHKPDAKKTCGNVGCHVCHPVWYLLVKSVRGDEIEWP